MFESSPYLGESALAMLKLLGWSGVVFVLLADRLGTARSFWEDAIRQVFVLMLIVHGLMLLHLFDTTALLVSYALYHAGSAWRRARQEEGEDGADGLNASQRASIALHTIIYDVLEGSISRADARDWARARLGRFRARARGIGLAWWQGLALACLLAGFIAPRLITLAYHPFPREPGSVEHALALKRMSANMSTEVLYPQGAHALALTLRSVSVLDEFLAWVMMGPVLLCLQGLVVFGIVWGVRRRFAEALIATAAMLLTLNTPLVGGDLGATQVHPWHFAATLLPICMWLSAVDLPGDGDTRGLRASSGALLLVHPLVWVLFVLGSALGMAGQVAMRTGRMLRPMATLGALAAGGVYAVCMTIGVALSRGVELSWRAWIGELWVTYPAGAEGAAQVMSWPLFTLGVLCAIVLLLVSERASEPTPRRTHLAMAFLGISMLGMSARFGIGVGLPPDAFVLLQAPMAAILLGETLGALRQWFEERAPEARHMMLDRAAVLAVALLVAQGSLARASSPPEPREVDMMRALTSIRDEHEAHTYTIVGPPSLAPHVLGYGWTLSSQEFITRYPHVEKYRWDPRYPDLAVPTPHTFLLADTSAPERSEIEQWCEEYMSRNDGMRPYGRHGMFVIYHLERTREEEKKILEEVWKAKQRSEEH